MRPLIVLVASLSLSCGGPYPMVVGNGVLATVERAVPGTTAVTVATSGDLTIRLGSPASVTITAEENLLQYLTSDVRGGELVLGTEPHVNLSATRGFSYVLTVPSLTAITVSSSGSVTAPALTAPDFALAVKSSGSITLSSLEANNLTTRIESSGSVRVNNGAVAKHSLTIQSSGDVVADGLRSTNATVNISSSGSALVWVTDQLDVTISSSGSVRYYGVPRLTTHLTSSGRVFALGGR